MKDVLECVKIINAENVDIDKARKIFKGNEHCDFLRALRDDDSFDSILDARDGLEIKNLVLEAIASFRGDGADAEEFSSSNFPPSDSDDSNYIERSTDSVDSLLESDTDAEEVSSSNFSPSDSDDSNYTERSTDSEASTLESDTDAEGFSSSNSCSSDSDDSNCTERSADSEDFLLESDTDAEECASSNFSSSNFSSSKSSYSKDFPLKSGTRANETWMGLDHRSTLKGVLTDFVTKQLWYDGQQRIRFIAFCMQACNKAMTVLYEELGVEAAVAAPRTIISGGISLRMLFLSMLRNLHPKSRILTKQFIGELFQVSDLDLTVVNSNWPLQYHRLLTIVTYSVVLWIRNRMFDKEFRGDSLLSTSRLWRPKDLKHLVKMLNAKIRDQQANDPKSWPVGIEVTRVTPVHHVAGSEGDDFDLLIQDRILYDPSESLRAWGMPEAAALLCKNRHKQFIVTHNRNLKISSDIDFTLSRIMLRFQLVYKIPGMEVLPALISAEVLDLSVSSPMTRKRIMYDQEAPEEIYQKIFTYNENSLEKLKVFTYTSTSQIRDLERMLFLDTQMKPWTDKKYGKRLGRYIWIFFLKALMHDTQAMEQGCQNPSGDERRAGELFQDNDSRLPMTACLRNSTPGILRDLAQVVDLFKALHKAPEKFEDAFRKYGEFESCIVRTFIGGCAAKQVTLSNFSEAHMDPTRYPFKEYQAYVDKVVGYIEQICTAISLHSALSGIQDPDLSWSTVDIKTGSLPNEQLRTMKSLQKWASTSQK